MKVVRHQIKSSGIEVVIARLCKQQSGRHLSLGSESMLPLYIFMTGLRSDVY